MEIDAETLSYEASYKLISGAVVSRPIAWVTSGTTSTKINLAPFSTFTFLSSTPPTVGFNCEIRAGLRKDTSRNIHHDREFVINIADETFLEALHLSSEGIRRTSVRRSCSVWKPSHVQRCERDGY